MHSQRIHAPCEGAPTSTVPTVGRLDVIEIPSPVPPGELSRVQRCQHAALVAVEVLDLLPAHAPVVAVSVTPWDGCVHVQLKELHVARDLAARLGLDPDPARSVTLHSVHHTWLGQVGHWPVRLVVLTPAETTGGQE